MSKVFISLLLSFLCANIAMAIEEPKYRVLFQEADLEVREYAPTLIAEVYVDGTRDEASNKGFRMIADFIFGNNQATDTSSSEKIAMTAPVTIEAQKEIQKESQKVAMTVPVTIEKKSSEGWRVQFTMPQEYTLASLPKPKNNAVKIREIPSKIYAVLNYSGMNGEEKVEEKTQALLAWCASKHYQIIGAAQLARYNPPWTLPPWRRNEVMIEIAPLKN